MVLEFIFDDFQSTPVDPTDGSWYVIYYYIIQIKMVSICLVSTFRFPVTIWREPELMFRDDDPFVFRTKTLVSERG